MHHTFIGVAAGLSDDELLRRLPLLAGRERGVTVELLAHLGELDKRRLHVPLGYGSLFAYCTGALRLAEHAAYNRIEAARACRRFPEILDRLATGSLNLSTLRLLAPHLTPVNHSLVLDAASGKSKRDVELLVAGLAPRPDASPLIRRLPSRETAIRASSVTSEASEGAFAIATSAAGTLAAGTSATGTPATGTKAVEMATVAVAGGVVPSCFERPSVTDELAAPPPALGGVGVMTKLESAALLGTSPAPRIVSPRRSQVTPLSPERYRLQVTVGREAHQDLRSLQELLRREIPDGDPGRIVERALRLLLDDVARRKLAAVPHPRAGAAGSARSRHVPAQVKRTVWLRDGGRCAFVARNGRRCRERTFLEFHHVEPYALGGETRASNLALRCRSHNRHEAEIVFSVGALDTRRVARRATRPGASCASEAPSTSCRGKPIAL